MGAAAGIIIYNGYQVYRELSAFMNGRKIPNAGWSGAWNIISGSAQFAIAGCIAGGMTGFGAGNELAYGYDAALSGTDTLGYTLPNGEVFIQAGLDAETEAATVADEAVHSFFSVADDALFAEARQQFGQWAYNNLSLVRYVEEALAETNATGSLTQGLAYPIAAGYVETGQVLIELGAYGGGIVGGGYLGNQIFNGGN